MAIAFLGMWWANKQYKGKGVAWGRPLAALLGACSIGLALISMCVTLFVPNGPNMSVMKKKHETFLKVAYKRFGQEVAKRHPDANILLIKRYLITRHESAVKSQQLRIDAFKDGLNNKCTIEVVEEATSGSEGSEEEMGMTDADLEKIKELELTGERFDELVKENKDCNLIVSMMGLPADMAEVEEMKLWKMKKDERPAIALADANIHYLKAAIQAKMISVILHRKPVPVDPDQPLPKTDAEIFDMMYMLVSADTIDKISQQFPKLFAAAE